mmetsp:Transcript_17447/g.28171  ORF Transcript_17447/g.28171 Transcript_17447/m.28171 type:complete len:105 (+) Transcript_17447:1612-1926(+)
MLVDPSPYELRMLVGETARPHYDLMQINLSMILTAAINICRLYADESPCQQATVHHYNSSSHDWYVKNMSLNLRCRTVMNINKTISYEFSYESQMKASSPSFTY